MDETQKASCSQTATKLIQFYGLGAEKEAVEQSERSAQRGDMESSEIWNRIAKAISEAQPLPELETVLTSQETASI